MGKTKGFTLVEMITLIAIILLLAVVSAPGVITVKNNLEMRQLDDTAREIFVAAQNNLSARRAAGTVGLLEVSEKDADSGDCWMRQSDPGRDKLLPDGSIEGFAAGHDFALYYNEQSGVVMEVYYSEKANLDDVSVDTLADSYRDSKRARREAKIGFYSVGPTETARVIDLPKPTVELLNSRDADGDGIVSAEEDVLKLVISVGKDLPSATHLTVTMAEKGNPSNTVTLYDSDSYVVLGGDRREEWILDSLEDGHQFRNLRNVTLSMPNLLPAGADVTVTATLSKSPDMEAGTTYRGSSGSAWGNSLFASLEDGTASIATPRHLQNLSYSFSNVNAIEAAPTVTAAVQTASIDWSGAAADSFIPITSNNDTLGKSLLTSYDGGGNVIRNLKVEGAGLFSQLEGSTLENVRLFAPVVTIGGGYATGSLIGSAVDAEITNCQAYTDSSHLDCGVWTKGGATGGLVGRAQNSTLTLCSASLPTVRGEGESGPVGGLAGKMVNSAAESCYASAGVRSGEGGAWEKGLSAVNAVGGLVGNLDRSTLSDCFVSGYVNSSTKSGGGGIVGIYTSGSMEDCYSVATLGDTTYLGIAGSLATEKTPTLTNVSYWSGGGADSTENAVSLGKIADLTGWAAERQTTCSYTESVCTGGYPYPMIDDLPYYGDWPIDTTVDPVPDDPEPEEPDKPEPEKPPVIPDPPKEPDPEPPTPGIVFYEDEPDPDTPDDPDTPTPPSPPRNAVDALIIPIGTKSAFSAYGIDENGNPQTVSANGTKNITSNGASTVGINIIVSSDPSDPNRTNVDITTSRDQSLGTYGVDFKVGNQESIIIAIVTDAILEVIPAGSKKAWTPGGTISMKQGTEMIVHFNVEAHPGLSSVWHGLDGARSTPLNGAQLICPSNDSVESLWKGALVSSTEESVVSISSTFKAVTYSQSGGNNPKNSVDNASFDVTLTANSPGSTVVSFAWAARPDINYTTFTINVT